MRFLGELLLVLLTHCPHLDMLEILFYSFHQVSFVSENLTSIRFKLLKLKLDNCNIHLESLLNLSKVLSEEGALLLQQNTFDMLEEQKIMVINMNCTKIGSIHLRIC
jgi:hypothetical protein